MAVARSVQPPVSIEAAAKLNNMTRQLPNRMFGKLRYLVAKVVMTLVLMDMGLGGPALQLWKSD